MHKIYFAVLGFCALLFSKPILASTGLGAKVDVGIFQQDGNGTEGSKSNTGIAQQRIDLFFLHSARNTTILVQIDFLQASLIQAFDDAWAQYVFKPELAVKAGIDLALSNNYGYFTEFYRPVIIDEVRGVPKIELSGSVDNFQYALQLWEDQPADYTAEDKDSGILTNYAIEGKYKVRDMEAGLIYRVNKGFEDTATNTKELDRTGYQLFGKYFLASHKLSLWAEYSQKYLTSDQEGNTSLIFGVTYLKIKPYKLHLSLQNLSSLANKNDDASEVESGSVLQLMADYIFNKNITYYAQIIRYGEKSVGNPNIYQLIGVGMRTRF